MSAALHGVAIKTVVMSQFLCVQLMFQIYVERITLHYYDVLKRLQRIKLSCKGMKDVTPPHLCGTPRPSTECFLLLTHHQGLSPKSRLASLVES